jgi:hypothetical protein
MAFVTFQNNLGFVAYMNLFVGAVEISPDHRGISNTTIPTGRSIPVDVGDGDVWYCFGRREIGGGDPNPQLCNASAGSTVVLSTDQNCFNDN